MSEIVNEILTSKKSNFYYVFILTLNQIINDFNYLASSKVHVSDFTKDDYANITFKTQNILLNIYTILPFKFTNSEEFVINDNLFRYDDFEFLNNELQAIKEEKNKDFFLFNYLYRNAFNHHIFNLDLSGYGSTNHQLNAVTFEITIDDFIHRRELIMRMYEEDKLHLYSMDMMVMNEMHNLFYTLRLEKAKQIIEDIKKAFNNFVNFMITNTEEESNIKVLDNWINKINNMQSIKDLEY